MNSSQSRLHAHALKVAANYRRAEWRLILVLQEVEQSKLFKKLNCPSLFQYAVKELGLSEPVAYSFIAVARKAAQVPALFGALKEQMISVPKASRIVSGLNGENAAGLIEFAASHSARETDFEMARLCPKLVPADRVKPLSEDFVELKISMRRSTYEKIERAAALGAQRKKRHLSRDEVLDAVFSEHLEWHDPVQKADRALAKQNNSPRTEQLCTNRVPRKRIPLRALEKHQVFARDRGRCTHTDAKGFRCNGERWLQVHHIVPVKRGGGNESENLTTLCSYHHDLVHQLSLPLEGQVSWLRSPAVRYSG